MQAKVHCLTIEGELDGIGRSSAWVAEMAEKLDLPRSMAFAMDVCFEEALSNIIVHGLKEAGPNGRKVHLSMARAEGGLKVVIEDHGLPFDPSGVLEPIAPVDLEHAQVGGLGVSLMRKLTHAMSYERKNGLNRLVLEFSA